MHDDRNDSNRREKRGVEKQTAISDLRQPARAPHMLWKLWQQRLPTAD
jgi:hypothetical protein